MISTSLRLIAGMMVEEKLAGKHGLATDDETSDCWAARTAPWSAVARGRLGWAVSSNARTVAPKESGDTPPHSKIANVQIPANAGIKLHSCFRGNANANSREAS